MKNGNRSSHRSGLGSAIGTVVFAVLLFSCSAHDIGYQYANLQPARFPKRTVFYFGLPNTQFRVILLDIQKP